MSMNSRRLEVIWNGTDNLVRLTFGRYNSRAVQYKAYLYIPKMPTNHSICMRRRMIRSWTRACGVGAQAARNLVRMIQDLHLSNGLHISDEVLVPVLEKLGLDDVGADLDLIGYYQSGTRGRRRLILLFGFNPDDLNHYLAHSVVRHDILNYGRNGDMNL